MGFADMDAEFDATPLPPPAGTRIRAAITAEQFARLAAPEVPCGFFTLTLTDGSRKRFRVRLERGSFCTGQRTLSRYCKIEADDDAEREWETIGVVSAAGFDLFKRWRNQWEAKWAAAVWALAHGAPAPGYTLEVEPRCWMTMRELKTPDAKRIGLGPTWAKRFGKV